MTPVGEISVLEKIQSEECQLGGEGSSGGFIYPKFNLCRDGILLALMVSRLVDHSRQILFLLVQIIISLI